ncbi:heptaprenyl diphosphate synthase component 1 [Niallia endozanthoxylica]|uniref:Heptaprenyl diphosphate synthase n=1 Tax=Niallia endozanthoxylica TaxID=2036016 RepID=A0A5J5HUA7_9BACI|nr:heptaprenyl diphosphate synthase component 1 [Niallia endozanthoxylica]KAA9026129.1 heptaprenyl diphosphate synthase [Niallia endozanthoxylica]
MIVLREMVEKLTYAKDRIEKYVFHPYLREYMIPPVIDEDKLLILISIVDQLVLSPHEKDIYVLSIMLMHVALDTHDQVTNTPVDEKNMKVRQLTVLAGDYYSGLYYKFLASLEDVQVIKALSEGVKNINEHKVFIYHKNQDDFHTIMNSVKMIEFSLIEKLITYYGVPEWYDSASNWLLVKRLIKEKKQLEKTGSSVVFEALERSFSNNQKKKNAEQKQDVMQIYDSYIDYSIQLMTKGMNKIQPFNTLYEERMMKIIKDYSPREKSFVEEG